MEAAVSGTARPQVRVLADPEALSRTAADLVSAVIGAAAAAKSTVSVALSGGSTPRRLYTLLGEAPWRERIEWKKVHLFWADERCVPPDDERSNYRMVRETWFDPAHIRAENIHRIHGECHPSLEALRYEQEIARFHRAAAFPAFDLILLGMGDNGHTASLFPGTAALRETARGVVAQYVEVMAAWRVTFTAPLINAARHVAFLAEGPGKAQMLWNVLEGPFQSDVWPSQLIQPVSGELHWLVDAAAAARVK